MLCFFMCYDVAKPPGKGPVNLFSEANATERDDSRAIVSHKKTSLLRDSFVPRAGIEPATQGFSVLCSTN